MDGALLSRRHFFRGARASEVGATRAAVERGENARSDGDGFNYYSFSTVFPERRSVSIIVEILDVLPRPSLRFLLRGLFLVL